MRKIKPSEKSQVIDQALRQLRTELQNESRNAATCATITEMIIKLNLTSRERFFDLIVEKL